MPDRFVHDDTARPSPDTYPSLLPTLQTAWGMVINGGRPQQRVSCHPLSAPRDLDARVMQVRVLAAPGCTNAETADGVELIQRNFEACASPVTKDELLRYLQHQKRLDIEQAVAMVVGYLASHRGALSPLRSQHPDEMDFEGGGSASSLVAELMQDASLPDLFTQSCMWRNARDHEFYRSPEEEAELRKLRLILDILGQPGTFDLHNTTALTELLERVRRNRPAEYNSQELDLPEAMLTLAPVIRDIRPPIILSKHRFRVVQRLIWRMRGSSGSFVAYLHDVRDLVAERVALTPTRFSALRETSDPAALAYSFLTFQRGRQRKVVSDRQWTRFLVKGEGALVLQNRPDVLTSFEDVLVRHARDLRALTAVSCPPGVRDHFSAPADILKRVRRICELMERYVDLVGGGKLEKLVFRPGQYGGSGRGPVDFYNALCDELRHCRFRAEAVGLGLDIGDVHKFLAKDIMSQNNTWEDDAFAGGKVPGWLEYLARVRAEEIKLE